MYMICGTKWYRVRRTVTTPRVIRCNQHPFGIKRLVQIVSGNATFQDSLTPAPRIEALEKDEDFWGTIDGLKGPVAGMCAIASSWHTFISVCPTYAPNLGFGVYCAPDRICFWIGV